MSILKAMLEDLERLLYAFDVAFNFIDTSLNVLVVSLSLRRLALASIGIIAIRILSAS
jgi:hypothetical protein